MQNIIQFLQEHVTSWAVQVVIVIILTLIASHVASNIFYKLHRKFKKTSSIWDDALVISGRKPAILLILIVGGTFALGIIHKATGISILEAIYPMRGIAVIAMFVWFINKFIREIQRNIITKGEMESKDFDRTTIKATGKILQASVVIIAVLIALQTLGFSIEGVLAFGGIGGIAIGFAAKDLLANFFGAIMIYFDRPFHVGDWICSPDKDIEGTVEEIGWRQTIIRRFDKRPLYVPNAVFSTISVENAERMTHRRISEFIGLRYDDIDKVEKIIKEIKKMLVNHKDVDEGQTLIVSLFEFAASAVNIKVYAFTHTIDQREYHETKQDILFKISKIIAKNGAEIAFPTTTVHIDNAVKA